MHRTPGQRARLTLLAAVVSVGMTLGIGAPASGVEAAALDIDAPIDLGVPSGVDVSFALASSAAGPIVGATDVEIKGDALGFSMSSPPTPLGVPAGYGDSVASDVNGSGVAIGAVTRDPGDGTIVPAIWVPGNAPALLSSFGTDTRTFAIALNDSGFIVGFGGNSDDTGVHPLTWTSGVPSVLDPLGHTVARAVDVNSSGMAVGHLGDGDLDSDPFTPAVWIPGKPALELATLGGSSAVATGVNDAGAVIGYSLTAGDADTHMFRWTVDGGMEDLGTPGPGGLVPINEIFEIIGPKINNQGQISLFGFGKSGPVGYVWTDADDFVPLPPFPGQQQVAYAINIDDAGRVVGAAATGDTGHPALWQIQQPDPPAPPMPPEPPAPPAPDPDAGGGGAGSDPDGRHGQQRRCGSDGNRLGSDPAGHRPRNDARARRDGKSACHVRFDLGVRSRTHVHISENPMTRVRRGSTRFFVAVGVLTLAVYGLAMTGGTAHAATMISPPVDYGLPLIGEPAFAQASNDSGTVVGFGIGASDPSAYQFFADRAPIPLGEPTGYDGSAARDVNADDFAVGWASDSEGTVAAIWVPETAPDGATHAGWRRTSDGAGDQRQWNRRRCRSRQRHQHELGDRVAHRRRLAERPRSAGRTGRGRARHQQLRRGRRLFGRAEPPVDADDVGSRRRRSVASDIGWFRRVRQWNQRRRRGGRFLQHSGRRGDSPVPLDRRGRYRRPRSSQRRRVRFRR